MLQDTKKEKTAGQQTMNEPSMNEQTMNEQSMNREPIKHQTMKQRFLNFIKTDTILFISGILAAISCCIIPPDREYADYVNYRVLAILFCLMLVVSALVRIGTFDYLTQRVLGRIHGERNISLFLVLLSFFLSMILTNDVALVTLVPFALILLKAFGDRRRTIYTLILMTVAANLGSMLTPIGNPQNLYLFTEYGFSMKRFTLLMLPYSILSLVLLVLGVFLLNRTDHTVDRAAASEPVKPNLIKMFLYIGLFMVCLLTVVGTLHYLIMLGIVAAAILFLDRGAFRKVDYGLLLTFVFFFLLIGNLGRIDVIRNTLTEIVEQNVTLTAVLSSQIISNVPAAMLLSAFTAQGDALLVGVNLGGLGTLIASMASLITYKFYAKDRKKGDGYLLKFTLINLLFLVALYLLHLIL